MYLIREVFRTKPGKAKELVMKFKKAEPYFEKDGMKNYKLMTDIATTYWTVVVEFETEDLNDFVQATRSGPPQQELQEIMDGYIDLLEGGNREIYLLE